MTPKKYRSEPDYHRRAGNEYLRGALADNNPLDKSYGKTARVKCFFMRGFNFHSGTAQETP